MYKESEILKKTARKVFDNIHDLQSIQIEIKIGIDRKEVKDILMKPKCDIVRNLN